jgi:hypothetical protein
MSSRKISEKRNKKKLLEQLVRDIAEARAQVKRGEVYSEEYILKEFGLI